MRLLVIRPQPHAARTALALRAHGHEPIVAPLIGIEVLADVDLGVGPWTAFLLTSVNALSGLAGRTHRDDVRSVPVFTVGERTAQEIREFGFTAVTSADGNVNDLVNLVAARLTAAGAAPLPCRRGSLRRSCRRSARQRLCRRDNCRLSRRRGRKPAARSG